MTRSLRLTAAFLIWAVAVPAPLWGQQATAPAPPPGAPPQQLPVDLAKIREALKQDPKLRLDTDELRFYVDIIGRIPTFEEIVGDFDLKNGVVPGAPMTHEEFLSMVTPKDLHSTTGITALDTLQVALTSYAMISMVKRAYEEYRQAQTERERRLIQERIEREVQALERQRAAAPRAAVQAQTGPAAPGLTLEAAKREIEQLIAASGADVAVAYRPLPGARAAGDLLIDADKTFHAASTMKVAVMIELFRQAGAGRVSLDDAIPVTNRFTSIVDGSPYEMSVTEDSDGEVYKSIGRTLTLRQLVTASITVSSNLATNILIEKLGADNVRRTVGALGAGAMVVLRGVEDQKAFDKGLNNATTARALLVLLEKIARGEAVSPAASRDMAALLRMQQFNDGIPAGLPAGTPVGHKTGTITRNQHDAAIVYAATPYVLVVLTRGIEDGNVSNALIAAISRVVYRIDR